MKIKWQPVVKAKVSLLFQWYVFEGHKKPYFQSSLDLNFGFKNQKIVSDEISIDLNEFTKLEKLLLLKIYKDNKFINDFIRSCYKYAKKLLDYSLKIKRINNLFNFSN